MKQLLHAIARWIDRADAGDINAVLFTAAFALALVLIALAVAIHGWIP